MSTASKKRALDATGSSLEDAPEAADSKRPRRDDLPQTSTSTSIRTAVASDSDELGFTKSQSQLPPPTSRYVRVRFQLARFKGVFRIVELPLRFSFYNLHHFIQYLFGWSGQHAHEAGVYANVVMYSPNNRPGEIKKCGRAPPFPEDRDLDSMPDHYVEWLMYSWEKQHSSMADFMAVPAARLRRYDRDLSWFGDPTAKAFDEKVVTLKHVWDHTTIEDWDTMGIKYAYDLSGSWDVHITLDGDEPFVRRPEKSNLPVVLKIKGAPPVEDCPYEYFTETDPRKKVVSPRMFDPQTFAKYLDGEVSSTTDENELTITDNNEE